MGKKECKKGTCKKGTGYFSRSVFTKEKVACPLFLCLFLFITPSFFTVKSFAEESPLKRIEVTEQGKHGPVTFEFAIEDGRIKDVTVLESAEVKGEKINQKRFLRQFVGKDSSHPIRIGVDIHAVTGATVSSETAARAARKALKIWEGLYQKEKDMR